MQAPAKLSARATTLCAASPAKRASSHRPADCDRSLSGTALDYWVRAVLRPEALQHTVATEGARQLDAGKGSTASRIEREAVAIIEALRPSSATLDGAQLSELSRMCLVLARFEQFFRAGPSVWEHVGPALGDWPTLELYAQRVVPDVCVEDVSAVASTAVGDFEALREADPLLLNPTFALSIALGGADADLIAAATLWDLKSSASATQVIRRAELWQIVGYALADTDDAHKISCVGIMALRRRTQVRWALPELLERLSESSRPLPQWRQEFAAVTASLKPRLLPSGRARLL